MDLYTSPPFWSPTYNTETITNKPNYSGGIRPRKINVEKMRRILARNTPDAVWRSFDLDSLTIEKDLTKWRDHWIKMMEIKHEGKNMHLEVFRSDILDPKFMGRIGRFQMTAVER